MERPVIDQARIDALESVIALAQGEAKDLLVKALAVIKNDYKIVMDLEEYKAFNS